MQRVYAALREENLRAVYFRNVSGAKAIFQNTSVHKVQSTIYEYFNRQFMQNIRLHSRPPEESLANAPARVFVFFILAEKRRVEIMFFYPSTPIELRIRVKKTRRKVTKVSDARQTTTQQGITQHVNFGRAITRKRAKSTRRWRWKEHGWTETETESLYLVQGRASILISVQPTRRSRRLEATQ